MKSLFKWLLLLPVVVVVLVFAVANRQATTVVIDPFGVLSGAMTISAPLYVILFLAVMFGVLIGGFASWIAQGVHRRAAREARADARAFRQEAESRRNEVEQLRSQFVGLPPPAASRDRRDAA